MAKLARLMNSFTSSQSNAIFQLFYNLYYCHSFSNSIFSYMLDGTAIKQAVELGKQGNSESCATLYSKCPINRENVMQIVGNLLPS